MKMWFSIKSLLPCSVLLVSVDYDLEILVKVCVGSLSVGVSGLGLVVASFAKPWPFFRSRRCRLGLALPVCWSASCSVVARRGTSGGLVLSSSHSVVVSPSRRFFCWSWIGGCLNAVGAGSTVGGENYCEILSNDRPKLLPGLEGMEAFLQGCPCDHAPIDKVAFKSGDDC